ncbi:uncharacterized protein [Antennarius striatus]|uniref:uncharacterized protein isoform X2 n=1 Tax=Antennarius striatus TaxID=241820 RepID=UPI0035AF6414
MEEVTLLLSRTEGDSRSTHGMAGIAHYVMKLLLLSLISVKGEDGLIFPGGVYEVLFSCEENLVCFQLWHVDTKIQIFTNTEYAAIVVNGEILRDKSEAEESKYTLQIKDLRDKDMRCHLCQKESAVIPPHDTYTAMADFSLMPGKMMSLQCILLPLVKQGGCNTQQHQITLVWVDEDGAEVQRDAHHQIKQRSACDTTLTVSFPNPVNKKFRCQVTVGELIQTSVELSVRVAGRGRGLIPNLQPENQGDNKSVVGAAVGVVGCVVLTAVVAAFLVKRRMSQQCG